MPIEDCLDRLSTLQGSTRTEALETPSKHVAAAPDGHRAAAGAVQPIYGRARRRAINATNATNATAPAQAGAPHFVRALHGELDISQKQSIEEEFGRIERLMPSVVILDLSDVGYLDTTFLNALMRTQARVFKKGDSFLHIVTPATSFISRIFAITKLDADFHLFEDVSSAQRYVAGP